MGDIHQTPHFGDGDLVFGPFRLDLRGGRLTRGSETIPLRPKTWAVLVYLAERPGTLVSKEDLLDAVWPDVAVTPDTLTKSIGELRLALGDDSKVPRYIETAHRRGFRFVADMVAPEPTVLAPREESATGWTREAGHACVVGRDAELERLHDLLTRAHQGRCQLAFVTGAAGVGKTTLIEAFLASPAVRNGANSTTVARGAAVEQHGAREAYLPVLTALARLEGSTTAPELAALLRRVAPTWLAQMPWLLGDDRHLLLESQQVAKAERMLREFAALTDALTAEQTLILVLEDLHWSDPSTVDLLALVAQRQEAARLLIIATYRPAEAAVSDHPLSPIAHMLKARRRCVEVPLHELSPEDVQTYLAQRFPGADFPLALASMLHEQTEGNPLFMVAVVENLLARGLILDTSPGWALSTPLEQIELGIPDDVGQMCETQIELLSPPDRELLEVASVSGTDLAVPAIAAVLDTESGTIEMRCERLARARRFLRTNGRTEWPDGSVTRRYAFTHELYRQVVYSGIPDGQRTVLHQRMGEALETAFGERVAEIAPLLAVHFEKSRDRRRAIRYLTMAGVRARQRCANREALGYIESALAALAHLSDGEARDREELSLRLLAATVLNDLHGFSSAPVLANCERTYVLCDRVGNESQRFQILHALSHIHVVRADPELAPTFVAEADALATKLGDPERRLIAASILVRSAAVHGRFADACRLAEQRMGAVATHLSSSPTHFGADPLIATCAHYPFALYMRGDIVRGRHLMSTGLQTVRTSGSPFTLTSALWFSAFLEMLARDVAATRRLSEEAAALATEHGYPFWNAVAGGLQGWVEIQEGATGNGIAMLKRAQAALASINARLFSTHICAFLGEAHLRAGDWDEGLSAVETGLEIAESTLDRTYWPELWRLKSELLLAAGNGRRDARAQAERCLRRALDLARKSGAHLLELRAATSLVRLSPRTRDVRALLARVCRTFSADAQSRDLDEARALLTPTARVARRPQPTVRSRPGLQGDAG